MANEIKIKLGNATIGVGKLQDKTITATKEEQTVTSDIGYDGLGKVTVEGYTVALQDKTVTPTGKEQLVTADNGFDGLNTVTVEGVVSLKLQDNKTVTPTTEVQAVTADEEYNGLKAVTVEGIPQEYTDNVYENGKSDGYTEGYKKGYADGGGGGGYKTKIVIDDSVASDVEALNMALMTVYNIDGYLYLVTVGGSDGDYNKVGYNTDYWYYYNQPAGAMPLYLTEIANDAVNTKNNAAVSIFSGVTFDCTLKINSVNKNATKHCVYLGLQLLKGVD